MTSAVATKKKAGRVSIDVPAPSAEVAAAGPSALSLSVPFVSTTKYAQREVHMTLKAPQAETLRAILEGLEQGQARLSSGQPVQNPQDALRWLLEEVARRAV